MKHIKLFKESWFTKKDHNQKNDQNIISKILDKMKSSKEDISFLEYDSNDDTDNFEEVTHYLDCVFDGDEFHIDEDNNKFDLYINGTRMKVGNSKIKDMYNFLKSIYKEDHDKKYSELHNKTILDLKNKYQ